MEVLKQNAFDSETAWSSILEEAVPAAVNVHRKGRNGSGACHGVGLHLVWSGFAERKAQVGVPCCTCSYEEVFVRCIYMHIAGAHSGEALGLWVPWVNAACSCQPLSPHTDGREGNTKQPLWVQIELRVFAARKVKQSAEAAATSLHSPALSSAPQNWKQQVAQEAS